jgi:anti-anti-sigma factor
MEGLHPNRTFPEHEDQQPFVTAANEAADQLSGPHSQATIISISVACEIAHLTVGGCLIAGPPVVALRETALRSDADFRLLVVNLRDLYKIDAAGLGALIFVISMAQSVGARFRLAAVPPRIRELLSITRLDEVLVSFEVCRDQSIDLKRGQLL